MFDGQKGNYYHLVCPASGKACYPELSPVKKPYMELFRCHKTSQTLKPNLLMMIRASLSGIGGLCLLFPMPLQLNALWMSWLLNREKTRSARETWIMRKMMQVQTDNQLGYGKEMTQGILKAIATSKVSLNPVEEQAFKAIKDWNGKMDLTSVGGTVFQFTSGHILKNALSEFQDDDQLKQYLNLIPHWDYLKRIPNGHAASLLGIGNRVSKSLQETILSGFQDGVKEMQEKLGDTPANWQWGEVHSIEFVHPVDRKKPLNLLFSIDPYPSPAEFTSINKIKSSISNHDYKVSSMPSTRRLINIGNLEQSYSILPTGNSRNFQSEYYDNQAQMFVKRKYRKIVFTEAPIKQNPRHHLVLRPE